MSGFDTINRKYQVDINSKNRKFAQHKNNII